MRSLRSLKSPSKFLKSAIGAWLSIETASVAAEENLKEALQARYGAMKVAMAAHDGSAIGALLAPDFESVDISGEPQTASQMIAEVSGLKSDPNKVSVTTLAAVRLVAGKATVEQNYDMKTARVGNDGVAHPVRLTTSSTDTWVKSGDSWLLQRTVTNEMFLFKDNRLVVHKVKP